jgi:hypothetical protein
MFEIKYKKKCVFSTFLMIKGVTDGRYISELRHEKKLIFAAFSFLISISFRKN